MKPDNILDGGIVDAVAAIAVEEARQVPHMQKVADPVAPSIDGSAVEIPEDWASLPWNAKRKIAAALSETHIINGEQAEAAIKAELARRAAKPAPKLLTTVATTTAKPADIKPAAPKPTPARSPAPVVFNDAFLASETKPAPKPTALKVEPAPKQEAKP